METRHGFRSCAIQKGRLNTGQLQYEKPRRLPQGGCHLESVFICGCEPSAEVMSWRSPRRRRPDLDGCEMPLS